MTEARLLLDAVLFDAGGTLVRLDYEWICAMLADLGLAVTTAELRRCEIRGRRMYDAQSSRPRAMKAGEAHPALGSVAPTNSYFAGMLEAAGCRHPVLEEALTRLEQKRVPPSFLWAKANEGAREAIAGVLALGLRAGCVSNSDGRAEAHLVECGVREGLELVVDSQIEGIEKPDAGLFRIALDRMGVAAERALYVGDIRSVDEAGARAAGMQFTLIDPFGDYAGANTLAVANIASLPAFVAEHFAVTKFVQ